MTTLYFNTDMRSCPVLSESDFTSQSHPLEVQLEDIIEFYPESERIIKFVQDFFQKIHADKNLGKASLFFKQVMIENEATFEKLSLQEKAQILFDLYKAAIIPILKNDSIYSSSMSELQMRISKLQATTWPEVKNVDSIPSLIDSLINREFNRLHSGYLRFSISLALEVDIGYIKLAGEGAAIINQKENINTSQHALGLFQAFLSAK